MRVFVASLPRSQWQPLAPRVLGVYLGMGSPARPAWPNLAQKWPGSSGQSMLSGRAWAGFFGPTRVTGRAWVAKNEDLLKAWPDGPTAR
jgi:hypothetical protein